MAFQHDPEVVIIGAGPYGVSVAAHLLAAGVSHRIFGHPMQRWRQMPKGMFLKSEGRATNLSDPDRTCTLQGYCAARGLPYEDWGRPVPLELFTQYAVWFQQKFAPHIDETMVSEVSALPDGFELRLADGRRVGAAKVVVATGLEYTAQSDFSVATLPSELHSHCEDVREFRRFRGKDITVIGGGQSALETAALAAEEGAHVRVLVRKPGVAWNSPPVLIRPWRQRVRHPRSDLGEGLGLWFCSRTPVLFRVLPPRTRLERVRFELGPSGAWWLKNRVMERVQILPGHFVTGAEAHRGQAVLEVATKNGAIPDPVVTDHVISATGYRFDLQRLFFLSEALRARVRTFAGQPCLSLGFESSVRGLYFTGLASAISFGPAMRFLAGTGYTARSVTRHIAARRRPSYAPPCAQAAGVSR